MRLRNGLAILCLLAGASALAAPQTSKKAPRDPELIDGQGYQKLVQQYKGKPLLVNFWATWCEPCLEEFSDLQKMVRMYRKRDLDIVTVSLNAPDEKKFVQKFLEEQHAINRNLLFEGTDAAEAVAIFGTGWSGGVPYTVLVGMNGEVLFKTQGRINALEVRRSILKNLTDDRYIGQHEYWNSSF